MERDYQKICDKVNEILKQGSSNEVEDMYNSIDVDIYWDRSVYFANKFDSNECRKDLVRNPLDYKCEPSDDMSEHPGIVFKFDDREIEVLGEFQNRVNELLSSGSEDEVRNGLKNIYNEIKKKSSRYSLFWDERIFNENGCHSGNCLDNISKNSKKYTCGICVEDDDYVGIIIKHKS